MRISSALKLTEQNVKQLADEYEQFGQKLGDTDVTRLIELDVAFDGLVDNVTQISKKNIIRFSTSVNCCNQ